MAEFIEVPIDREDGSRGLHFVNLDAISYVDLHREEQGQPGSLAVYLANGYWFTLSGPKAGELMHLITARLCVHLKSGEGDH